jgi:hypothetical protein
MNFTLSIGPFWAKARDVDQLLYVRVQTTIHEPLILCKKKAKPSSKDEGCGRRVQISKRTTSRKKARRESWRLIPDGKSSLVSSNLGDPGCPVYLDRCPNFTIFKLS